MNVEERTFLDRLLRREVVTMNPAAPLVVKHKKALADVQTTLTATRQKVAEAINETGTAIERRHGIVERRG